MPPGDTRFSESRLVAAPPRVQSISRRAASKTLGIYELTWLGLQPRARVRWMRLGAWQYYFITFRCLVSSYPVRDDRALYYSPNADGEGGTP